MKTFARIIITSFAAACLLAALSDDIRAQTGQCDNCLADAGAWKYSSLILLPDAAGCSFTVEFRYRTSTSCSSTPNYDLEILGIKGWTEACTTPTFNPGAMVTRALQYLLNTNPMGFPPNSNNQCVDQIRGFVSQCLGPNGTTKYLTPCAGGVCCTKTYRVCMVNNQRIVTLTASTNPNPQVCISGGINCFPVCEEE